MRACGDSIGIAKPAPHDIPRIGDQSEGSRHGALDPLTTFVLLKPPPRTQNTAFMKTKRRCVRFRLTPSRAFLALLIK